MNKILLIVDPQIDFISGSLAVEGAKEKMDALANALLNDDIDCDCVMVTKDCHPSNHCSFKENGGQWLIHCVIGTTGSCIYTPLWSVLNKYNVNIFTKGNNPDKEEYSVFDTGFKPANIVMKLTSCQMNPNQPIFGCVKLSDDAGKHTGKIEDVQRCLIDLGYGYRIS